MGKFKDELNGEVISEFIGLKRKMYSVKVINHDNSERKAKGVIQSVLENAVSHKNSFGCLN